MPILRVTLFKIPESADVDKALEAYEKLKANQQKVCSDVQRPRFEAPLTATKGWKALHHAAKCKQIV
jgi:hypothetical protein